MNEQLNEIRAIVSKWIAKLKEIRALPDVERKQKLRALHKEIWKNHQDYLAEKFINLKYKLREKANERSESTEI